MQQRSGGGGCGSILHNLLAGNSNGVVSSTAGAIDSLSCSTSDVNGHSDGSYSVVDSSLLSQLLTSPSVARLPHNFTSSRVSASSSSSSLIDSSAPPASRTRNRATRRESFVRRDEPAVPRLSNQISPECCQSGSRKRSHRGDLQTDGSFASSSWCTSSASCSHACCYVCGISQQSISNGIDSLSVFDFRTRTRLGDIIELDIAIAEGNSRTSICSSCKWRIEVAEQGKKMTRWLRTSVENCQDVRRERKQNCVQTTCGNTVKIQYNQECETEMQGSVEPAGQDLESLSKLMEGGIEAREVAGNGDEFGPNLLAIKQECADASDFGVEVVPTLDEQTEVREHDGGLVAYLLNGNQLSSQRGRVFESLLALTARFPDDRMQLSDVLTCDGGGAEIPLLSQFTSTSEKSSGRQCYSCRHQGCMFTCWIPSAILAHELAHENSLGNQHLDCPVCGTKITSSNAPRWKSLVRHLEVVHKVNPVLFSEHYCTLCDMLYRSYSQLQKHVLRAHNSHSIDFQGVFSWQCERCQHEFRSQAMLQAHAAFHRGNHSFVCHECGWCHTAQPGQWRFMRTHVTNMHNINTFLPNPVCRKSNCKEGIFSKLSRQLHDSCHTEHFDVYQCHVCFELHQNWSSFKSHLMRQHPAVILNAYKCTCGVELGSIEQLKEHINSSAPLIFFSGEFDDDECDGTPPTVSVSAGAPCREKSDDVNNSESKEQKFASKEQKFTSKEQKLTPGAASSADEVVHHPPQEAETEKKN